jgi:hypothetical protein
MTRNRPPESHDDIAGSFFALMLGGCLAFWLLTALAIIQWWHS